MSMHFILLINIKMSTIVGILKFISRINKSECFKRKTIFLFQYFSFYEHLKCHAHLS